MNVNVDLQVENQISGQMFQCIPITSHTKVVEEREKNHLLIEIERTAITACMCESHSNRTF